MALNKNVAKGIKTRQENELLENNKLIAEFMRLIIRDEEGNLPVSSQQHKLFIKEEWDKLDVCSPYSPNGVDYHASWDYLMLVVDRIEGVVDEHGCAKYNVRIEQCWVDIIDNHTSDEIVTVDGDNRREATYKAVVEFIKWHNEQATYKAVVESIKWHNEQDRFICGVCGDHVNEYTYNENKDVDECNKCK